uniref:Nuclear receptor domain-containing protein n=2 Tax=Ascaris TaxID=6251 RepID=A0A9J2PEQ2_ASCLU
MIGSEESSAEAKNHDGYINSPPSELPQAICVVCGDLSDGPHFGVNTCRACAAFFRRTVSLKLEYTCRAQSKCNIDKSARNMCRSCRFQKCLRAGMIVTAVQQSRDGIGKRISPTKPRSDRQPQTKKSDSPTVSTSVYGVPWISKVEQPTMVTRFSQMEITQRQESDAGNAKMRILPKMLDGYHHFLSIRKATFSLAEDTNFSKMFKDEEIDPNSLQRSNFDVVNKVCRMESHIATDIVNNYFIPFKELPAEEKIVLFKNFYWYLTNTDRAYQSYRAFGSNPYDDRLLMPDGGYIRMTELEKFYENTVNCKADPKEAARLFQPAMSYIVNVIVEHIRRIEMSDYEYVAVLGMFLWNDSLSNISLDTVQMIWSARSAIFEDLHIHYRSRGFSNVQISVKLGNLMMLIPKIQRSVALFTENMALAELFNIFEADHCCSAFRPD